MTSLLLFKSFCLSQSRSNFNLLCYVIIRLFHVCDLISDTVFSLGIKYIGFGLLVGKLLVFCVFRCFNIYFYQFCSVQSALLCSNISGRISLAYRNNSVLSSRNNRLAAVYDIDFNCLVGCAAVFVLYLILYLVGSLLFC